MASSIQKISASELLIRQCLDFQDNYYKVPDYQRRYSWGKEQIEDFWYDLNSIEIDNEEHFLGSIVVITRQHETDFNKLELVDGQQRITTIMLLLKTISVFFQEAAKENEDKIDEIGRDINSKFLHAKNHMAQTRTRLELGNLDNWDYENIIEHNNIENIENENILNTYNFFHDKIQKLNIQEVLDIYKKLLNQMIIVLIESKNEKSAFRLFETLNDRGLELSAIDLMKNYLLKVVSHSEHIDSNAIKGKWESILTNIQSINRKVRFFRHYIMAFEPDTNQKITQKKVYDRFKEIIDTDLKNIHCSIEEYIEDIELKSEQYRDICSADISSFSNQKNAIINDHLKSLNSIGASPSRTLLIKAFYELKDANEIIKLLELLEIFSIRRIIGQYSTGELDTIYNKLALEAFKKDSPVDFIGQYFEDNVPGDSEFIDNFRNRNFRSNDQTKYILDKIERDHFMVSGQGKAIKDRSEVHLEHIAPTAAFTAKKYSEWATYFNMNEDDFDDFKTRIGNITLFETTLNISASDKPFQQKKNKYLDSDFYMTRQLANNYNTWKKEDILHRTKELAQIAVDIWSF